MKLIYTANARFPSEKAHPYQIMQMCEAFVAVGLDLTLLIADRRNVSTLTDVDLFDYYGLARTFTVDRVPCWDVYVVAEWLPARIGRWWTYGAAALVMLTYHIALWFRLARVQDDAVLYTRNIVTLALLAMLRPRLARRAFFEAHSYPRSRIGRGLRRFVADRIGGVVTITEHMRDDYAAFGVPAERLMVAHDGYRQERFDTDRPPAGWRSRIGWPEDAFIVGYMGRFQTLGMDKGLSDLLAAVIRLAQDTTAPPVRLGLVGGPDDDVERMRVTLTEQGMSPDLILYAGQVPPAEVPGYLRAFDVSAMPFPWTEHFAYYASPLKLFEYMAAGGAIVATEMPSTAEIIRNGENGLLVPPSDVDALAKALRRLRDDAALRAQLGQQAARDAAAYTWQARAARIAAFIAEIIN